MNIDTSTYTNDLTLRIQAEDAHHNITTEEISLLYGGSSIPTFSVDPGNSEASFDWDDPWDTAALTNAPGITYNLYYTTDGSSPVRLSNGDPGQGTTLVSDVEQTVDVVTGLQDGDKHVFLLTADITGFDPSFSEEVTAVPLSPFSYCPTLKQEELDEVIIEWPDYDNDTGYTVWRSLDEGSTWQKISGNLTTNSFTDSSVSSGDLAWYKVKPVQYSDEESYYSAIKVHYLEASTSLVSGDLFDVGTTVDEMTIWDDGSGNTYLFARLDDEIRQIDVTDPASMSVAATVATGCSFQSGNGNNMAIANDRIFVTDDDGGDPWNLRSYDLTGSSFTPGPGIDDVSGDYGVLGIEVWYGDGDGTGDNWWIFAVSPSMGGTEVQIIRVDSSTDAVSVENTLTGSHNPVSNPVLYYEDDVYKVSWIEQNSPSDDCYIVTIADLSSLDLTGIVTGDLTESAYSYAFSTALTNSVYADNGFHHLRTDDGSHFFMVDRNFIWALTESDMDNFAVYSFHQNPGYLGYDNGSLYTGSSVQYLTTFLADQIDYETSHVLLRNSQTRVFYSYGICNSDGTGFFSRNGYQTLTALPMSKPSVELTHQTGKELIGSGTGEMDFWQNVVSGDTLYSFVPNATSYSGVYKYDIPSLLGTVSSEVCSSDFSLYTGGKSAGLFAAGDGCFSISGPDYPVYVSFLDGSTGTAADYSSDPVIGKIGDEAGIQIPIRYGHYLFTGGYSSLSGENSYYLGTYDISSLMNDKTTLLSYSVEGISQWVNARRAGNYAVTVQVSNEEMIVMDISDMEDISEVNRIDIPENVRVGSTASRPNNFMFAEYRGYLYVMYGTTDLYNGLYRCFIGNIPVDELETATWDDFEIIQSFEFGNDIAYGSNLLSNQFCFSGDYMFTVSTSGNLNGLADFRVFRLTSDPSALIPDYVNSDYYTSGVQWQKRPVSGLFTDGDYLYVIFQKNSTEGGIQVYSITKNFVE